MKIRRKFHKDENGAKVMKLKLLQQLFNCDDVNGDFDEDRKIGDVICGMNILKKKNEKNCKYQ